MVLNSCNSQITANSEKVLPLENEDAIFAIWKRVKIDHNYRDKEHEEMVRKYPIGYDKDYYISIFPDGRGSISFKTELDSIVWIYNNSEELLIPKTGSMYHGGETIKLIESENDTLLKLIDDIGFAEMTFKKHSNLTTNYKEDPNYPSNNLWRIRAKKKISDSKIELKVHNYLKHYELLFKASLDNENKRSFTNKHSKGILRVYQSAIGIVSKDQIDEDWYSYFYTEEEALKAYNILKEKLKNNNTKTKKSQNWIKDNYEILRKLNGTQE
ncbi:MAG: hypothetical protein ACNS60_15510 [Candidatus Cyclobacteriaceae bacterium M2_1C_046]